MSNLHTVLLPDIGEGVVEGEIIEWLKKPGDAVAKDEPVVIVMTDKATVELPSPVKGSLAECHYKQGEIALVGKPIYSISTSSTVPKVESAQPAAEQAAETVIEPFSKPEKKKYLPSPSSPIASSSNENLALPSTRHLAKELHIDLNTILGTGKEGRITPEDLLQHSTPVNNLASSSTLPPDAQKLTGVRRLMLKKMTESHQTIPQFSYFERVDATRLIQLRTKLMGVAEEDHIHLTYMPFFIRALSLTIKQFPLINSSVDAETESVQYHHEHHIGIAIASEQGLIVPVFKNVENMGLGDVIRQYESFKAKKSYAPEEMRGSTITISNFGVLGGEGVWATPIINPPEVAILALAKIVQMPVVVNSEIVIRDMLNLSWTFDHRIIDGQKAAQISHFYAELIQNPARLL